MKTIEALSFGGGVQSNAIAVLIAKERLPRPDVVVIADTRYETESTWEYWDAYGKPLFDRLGIPAFRVSRADTTLTRSKNYPLMQPSSGRRILQIPAFQYGSEGRRGKLRNFCSENWKRDVVHHFLSKQYPKAKAFREWIGFSTDEIKRARRKKIGEGKWRIRFPLIELRVSRSKCTELVGEFGWPTPPRSSCYICPHRTNSEWRKLRDERPGEWRAAQRIEAGLRRLDPRGDEFPITLHVSGKVLAEAPIEETAADRAKIARAEDQTEFGFCEGEGGCFT